MTIISNSGTVHNGGNLSGLASSALPSLGGDSLTRPTWKRNLQELAASNIALMGHSSNGAAAPPPTTAAQMMLGSRTDFGSLAGKSIIVGKSQSHHIESHAAKASSSSNRFSFDELRRGGIEAVVRQHRDGILLRISREQREQTRVLLDKAVERQIEDDWKEERSWWRRELVGDRNLVDATAKDSLGTSSMTETFGIKQRATPAQGLLVADYSGVANNENTMYATGCDPKAMQEHLGVVKEIHKASDPVKTIASFEQMPCMESFGGGYKNAWMILKSMLPKMHTPVTAAQGAQTHLCQQYQTIIFNRVKSASFNGQDISTPVNYGSNNKASLIASYVKLISGSNASVWEILYYCLRCGEAKAANVVLNATPAGREEFSEQPILSQVISQLSARQGNASCMFENGSPMISSHDHFRLCDLYEKAKNLESSNDHKISVLALLCGKRLESFSTVEDYLFGNLWLALMDKENPIQQIEVIGASVRKYGPSHFAADDSGEWGYVLPLIATQQFETALSYLAEAGGSTGMMQAAHLGVVFSLARADVADLGDVSPSSRGSARRDIVTALLVNYVSLLEREPSAGIVASLEYLLKIPKTEEAKFQVASLIHRSPPNQVEVLTGVLDAVGNRKNSVLDEKLSDHVVSEILITAAELFKKQASDRSKGEQSAKLFMLGYGHSKVVQFLNEQISPVNVSNYDKLFWMQQSEHFYNVYLSKRTNVLASIEGEGKLPLIDTNRILLELRSFFDTYRERKFEEAFRKIARMGLLPLAENEINEKCSKFRDFDPILKNEFPNVLTASMECLCEHFHRLKSESRGLSPTVMDSLKELQYFARYLFLFAGLINMPSTCKTDMQRMRANMIV